MLTLPRISTRTHTLFPYTARFRSIVWTTSVYGYGGGWFGAFSRAALVPFVLAMWALTLAWSAPWLARFAYGPVEWLWRSLARRALQPMRISHTQIGRAHV